MPLAEAGADRSPPRPSQLRDNHGSISAAGVEHARPDEWRRVPFAIQEAKHNWSHEYVLAQHLGCSAAHAAPQGVSRIASRSFSALTAPLVPGERLESALRKRAEYSTRGFTGHETQRRMESGERYLVRYDERAGKGLTQSKALLSESPHAGQKRYQRRAVPSRDLLSHFAR